jgi:hypothetical protein
VPIEAEPEFVDPVSFEDPDSRSVDSRSVDSVEVDSVEIEEDGTDRKAGGGSRELMLIAEGHVLRVAGGAEGDKVALLIGREQIEAQLPGGEVLRVAPLAILALGEFDGNGGFETGPALAMMSMSLEQSTASRAYRRKMLA